MRSISSIIANLPERAIHLDEVMKLLEDTRKEALNEAERIARRDEHAETADKIAALKNVA